MASDEEIEELLRLYDHRQHDLRIFMEGVVSYIGEHPELNVYGRPAVHSYKSRLKDREHLREKIGRKSTDSDPITEDNFFQRITDLAGVRILHLFQGEFSDIDGVIRKRIADGDWVLSEQAMAYTWDSESVEFFQKFDLEVSQKPTSYTSVHYLLRPRADSPICCELQVRTLFEEIWGEVDHRINFPNPSMSVACREQIAVLSKLIGAGSRLLDALDRVHSTEQVSILG
jgi:putative GTP pyrophosphokinase